MRLKRKEGNMLPMFERRILRRFMAQLWKKIRV
jgi:hypothetical protein